LLSQQAIALKFNGFLFNQFVEVQMPIEATQIAISLIIGFILGYILRGKENKEREAKT